MPKLKEKIKSLKRRDNVDKPYTEEQMQAEITKKLGPGFKFLGFSERGIEVEKINGVQKLERL